MNLVTRICRYHIHVPMKNICQLQRSLSSPSTYPIHLLVRIVDLFKAKYDDVDDDGDEEEFLARIYM